MRKRNPRDVVDDFGDAVGNLKSYYDRVVGAVTGDPYEHSILSTLAEQTLFSLAALWEAFISDYFVACINRESEAFKENLRERMRDSIREKFGQKASRYTQIAFPKHPSVDDILALAAKDERNIAFRDTAAMVNRASDWLAMSDRARFQSLSHSDRDLVDAVIKIRNYIAHRSRSAAKEMDEALSKLAGNPRNQSLGRTARKVRNVGAFLKAWAPSPRVLKFCDRVVTVAGLLRP